MARGLWLPPCPLDSAGGASRPPSAAGWALADGGQDHLEASQLSEGRAGLGPRRPDGLSRSRCIYGWEIGLTLQWPRCVPGGAGSGRCRGPGLHSLPCPRPSPSVGHEPDLPCSRVHSGALCGHHHTQQAGSGCLLSAGPRSPDASHSLGLNPSSVTLSEAPAALCCSFPICEMGTVMPQSHSED